MQNIEQTITHRVAKPAKKRAMEPPSIATPPCHKSEKDAWLWAGCRAKGGMQGPEREIGGRREGDREHHSGGRYSGKGGGEDWHQKPMGQAELLITSLTVERQVSSLLD
ncbi:hypothetical protein CDAR_203721 [Caerostris darwini]|uniref:Uncharacterized protein n=1 Tax=Caerostris darwini TaxID=1538125 RepID=A0AAV4PDG9_9ARAC|nr:hypothetical protein CDAR_203721 [Caerostris darwini]